MYGSSFYDAYNKETDRVRRIRSENRQAYQSFVEMQRASGARVDPAEFERFARSLGTSPFTAQSLPSRDARQQTAQAINAEVAAREAARAQAARAASLQQAQSELDALSSLATQMPGVDLETEDGMATFAETAQSTLDVDPQPYADILPGMVAQARQQQALGWIDNLQKAGITTPEAAEPFLRKLPEGLRSILSGVYESRAAQAKQDEIDTASNSISQSLPDIVQNFGGDPDLVSEHVQSLAQQQGLPQDAVDRLVTQARSLAEGQSRTRMTAADASVTADQAIPLLQNEDALRAAAQNRLAAALGRPPTNAEIGFFLPRLRQRAEIAASGAYARTTSTIIQRIMTPEAGAELSDVESIGDARAKAEELLMAHTGGAQTLSDLPVSERRALMGAIMNRARGARRAIETEADSQWVDIISGVATDAPEAQRIRSAALTAISSGGGQAAIFDVMNAVRQSLGLEPYASMEDESFLEDMEMLDSTLRTTVLQDVQETRNAMAQTAQERVQSNLDTQRSRMDEWVGTLANSENLPAGAAEVALHLTNSYYFGPTSPSRVITEITRRVEQDPDAVSSVEGAIALADDIARGLGLPRQGMAVQSELENTMNARDLPDYYRVAPGTSVFEYRSQVAATLTRIAETNIAAIEQGGHNLSDAELEAKREEIIRQLTEAPRGLAESIEDGGLGYILGDSDAASISRATSELGEHVARLVARLEEATPTGLPPGAAYVAGTDRTRMYLEEGNTFGLPAGTYQVERGADGRIGPGAPAPDEPGAAPDTSADRRGRTTSDGLAPYEPQSEAGQTKAAEMARAVFGPNQRSAILRTFENVARGIRMGDFGPATDPAMRYTRDFFNPAMNTDRARAEREALSAVVEFIETDDRAYDYLRRNPESVELLQRDPIAWAEQAGLGQR